jgi:hypothetical protein
MRNQGPVIPTGSRTSLMSVVFRVIMKPEMQKNGSQHEVDSRMTAYEDRIEGFVFTLYAVPRWGVRLGDTLVIAGHTQARANILAR